MNNRKRKIITALKAAFPNTVPILAGFLFLGMVIAMNGLVMIQAANIRLERSKEMKEKETRDGSENTKNGQ